MKHPAVALALLAALLFLSGCTMPWEQQAPPASQNQTQPAPVANASASNASNSTGNETIARNETAIITPPEKLDPFAGIVPRSVSSKISDGQFRINDLPGAGLNIYVINDGYADSILVNKGEFYMLVDSGSSQQTLDFLRQLGVTNLNVVVATRDDPGAIDGLSDVLDAYPAGEFWDNGVQANPSKVALVPASTDYADLLAKVNEKNITVKYPQAGDHLTVSGMDIDVLNPQTPRLNGNPDVDAVVLKLSFNSFCALLLNPTVQERETAFLPLGQGLQCNVVTYFKHGEGRPTPSLLLNQYPPQDAIISVGPNYDGLPSKTALTWLQMQNINAWRTDLNGTIRVSSDGSTYHVTGGQ